jgi:protein arginine kinase
MLQSILTHAIPSWLSHQGRDCDVVVSTKIRLIRNCAGRLFPGHASSHVRTLVFEEVTDAFRQSGMDDSFNSINVGQLDARQRQFLFEERLVSQGLADGLGDRGLIHDRSGRVCVLVNDEDHIRIQCLDSGCCAGELWAELDAIDDAVGMRIVYAYDNRLGFLTCRPTETGTGLRVSFCAHLPALALTGSLAGVLGEAERNGLSARGFSGNPVSRVLPGSLVLLSKSAVMGSSESAFCDDMAGTMRRIGDRERKARERILSHQREFLTDKIAGAYGALDRAMRLGVEEFFDLSSFLRLGIECNLFDKCTIQDLNRLTLFIMPAHLQTVLKRDLDDVEISEARAGLVRSFFSRNIKE